MRKILITILCFAICNTFFADPVVVSRLNAVQFGQERPKIGVVLSGGGAKGMAHVGTLKVLEELNIPIDFIGGTSMGSVVGSLYALGYTAHQIDTILRTIDWASMFNDFPKREHVGVHEKRNNDPYQLRLALAPNEIAIFARGAIDGQHIDNMLTHFLFESYKTPSFSNFQIPFFAVATDLIAAQYVVLDSGNLAQAVRASMAVPTVFSPVEIDGRLLVDGGVINNFPVLEMRRRGADIIIGVDVGYQYKDISELQNFTNIFEQVMFMGGQDLQQKNVNDCDIYIVPDLHHLTAFNFSRYDDILQRGSQAAETARLELIKLADLLSKKYGRQNINQKLHAPPTTVILDSIILNGNDKFSDQYVLSRLQLKTDQPISVSEIEEAVHRLFGSLSFTKITFHFDESPTGQDYAILHINLQEAPLNTVKLGFRYDNIRGPSLLAGLTMKSPRNLNSEFNVNLDLSLLPIIDLEYRFVPGIGRGFSLWRPTLFVSYAFSNLKIYDYNVVKPDTTGLPVKIFRDKEYRIVGQSGAIGTEFNVKSNVLGLGLFLDQTISNERIGGTGQRLTALYLYPQFYYLRNSFNKKYYPTSGSTVNVRFRWLHSLDRNSEISWVKTFGTYYADMQTAIPVSKRLTVYPSAMIAGTFVFDKEDVSANYISEQQQFYQGGLFHIPHINQTPFVGLYFMQKVGLYGANVQINTQYEAFRNFFITARFGALQSENDYAKMFEIHRATLGWGISASLNTTVGPVGVTVQRSTESPMSVFINLGFWL